MTPSSAPGHTRIVVPSVNLAHIVGLVRDGIVIVAGFVLVSLARGVSTGGKVARLLLRQAPCQLVYRNRLA